MNRPIETERDMNLVKAFLQDKVEESLMDGTDITDKYVSYIDEMYIHNIKIVVTKEEREQTLISEEIENKVEESKKVITNMIVQYDGLDTKLKELNNFINDLYGADSEFTVTRNPKLEEGLSNILSDILYIEEGQNPQVGNKIEQHIEVRADLQAIYTLENDDTIWEEYTLKADMIVTKEGELEPEFWLNDIQFIRKEV